MDSLGLDGDGFLLSDPGEVLFQRIKRNPSKIEALAAAKDGWEDSLRIGGCEHEHHLWGWFFQRLEQGVEGCRGEHVAFIHHVHLPAGLNRCKARPFDQFPDVVDASVGRGINFDHIEGCARSDRAA